MITFDTGALPDNASAEELRDAAIFRDTYLHITSLLHAIAIQTLCSEGPRADLVMHDSLAQSPAADARLQNLDAIFGRTHMGMSSWHDVFMLRGRVLPPPPPPRLDCTGGARGCTDTDCESGPQGMSA